MNYIDIKYYRLWLFLIILFCLPIDSQSQILRPNKFKHPGIDQSLEDLEYMKSQTLKGEQPWKDAFERVKAATNLDFKVIPHTHVVRGSYGKPNIGGDDLSKGANMAYNSALLWYITGNKAYAEKSIEIIKAWSERLWDFDYNDAKLLAGWTGYLFCNAAEILKYTESGWKQKDIDSFTNMLMTVYYPLMRYYFPQANGNWDGAIIHSILAIAIFTDNHEMFNNAIDHFLYGPVNGSIFKYIYPSGQCQETMRDQAHVQLGLGEFAGAARIAYTQGVDLFSIADNRIALGFEYTAKVVLGEYPHSYGPISERAKKLRDDYEYVYRHYTSKGVQVPYTKKAADEIRPEASRSILTAFRAPSSNIEEQRIPQPSKIAFPAGAKSNFVGQFPHDAIFVKPGESLQDALNSIAGTERWVVALAGVHTLPATLLMPNKVTLAGEGLKTILFLDPSSGRDAIKNAENNSQDITIRDLVVEGNTRTEFPSDPNSARSYRSTANRGGIMLHALQAGQIKNINLINVTVQNCTYNGVFISGASNVKIENCDFNENGSSVVPGPKLQHNLLLSHCANVEVSNSRLDTSPHGSGIALTKSSDVKIISCEVARNAYYGVTITESNGVSINGSLIEGNDRSGIMVEFLHQGSENVSISNNIIHYNNGYGVESFVAKKLNISNNKLAGNKSGNQNVSDKKYIIMNSYNY